MVAWMRWFTWSNRIVHWRSVPPLVLLLSTLYLVTFVASAQDSAYDSRAGLAVSALGGGGLITFLFPVALLLPAALSWSAVSGHRALVSVHSRTSLRRYLGKQLAQVFLATGVTIVGAHLLVFLCAFYVLSSLDVILYDPVVPPTAGAEADGLSSNDQFGSLAQIHPLAWGLGHAAWHGVWAGLLALLACASLLILSNRFLALSLPALIFYVGSLVLGAIPPMHVVLAMVVFPTLWGPQGWEVFLIPLAALVVVTAGVVVYALARLPSTPVMR